VPMIHCPPLRKGPQLNVGMPITEATAVASSGPNIHGKGVCKARQTCAANHAKVIVPNTRSSNVFPLDL
jgi:hypothetical protein